MDKNEFAQAVINDDQIIDAFFNLYCRWQDEWMYEDINEYGKYLCKHISKLGNVAFAEATTEPFGIKVKYGNHTIHFFAKVKNVFFLLCAKG